MTYYGIHNIFRRILENVQDIIVIGICVALFALMIKALFRIISSFLAPFNFQYIASELIYILVLVEIYRLLIIYLREHRIAVDIMIEVGIVSILREVILHGILEIDPLTMIAIAILFISLMLLLRYGSLRHDETESETRETFFKELKKSFTGTD
ncbi:MAG TPA: phosphate-starvation-inducible PsiE family protein [Methanoregulaceae archaeon]|nr:MAG: Phosphate-starvation-inducible E [Methanoregulaceae archaeon PtaB.Bin152]OPY43758.1 MAG: Phosphate-starvation-inducible E [Methanoregulaceae archaeon PtaU1.Bin059]HPD11503.1 phosphate-starvation-inducible PsiE family protein [Methanoregulaceae archaeon]